MQEQKLYGRWEYSLGDSTVDELFDYYEPNKVIRKDRVQIGGISCAVNINKNTAILTTYDEESEIMLRLKFATNTKVSHHIINPLTSDTKEYNARLNQNPYFDKY